MIIDMPTVSIGTNGSIISADRVSYDNVTSGLEADNVQDAVDELVSQNESLSSTIGSIVNNVTTRVFLKTHIALPSNIGVEQQLTENFVLNKGTYIIKSRFAPEQNSSNAPTGFGTTVTDKLYVIGPQQINYFTTDIVTIGKDNTTVYLTGRNDTEAQILLTAEIKVLKLHD